MVSEFLANLFPITFAALYFFGWVYLVYAHVKGK